jgi:hypothetical protein
MPEYGHGVSEFCTGKGLISQLELLPVVELRSLFIKIVDMAG